MNEPSKRDRSSAKDESSTQPESEAFESTAEEPSPQAKGKLRKIEILNKLQQPLMVTLAEGKSLYLGPRESATVTDKDLASPVVQRMLSQRNLIVLSR